MTTETGMYMLVCISGVVGLVYHGGVLSSRMRKLARVMYKVGSARRYRIHAVKWIAKCTPARAIIYPPLAPLS